MDETMNKGNAKRMKNLLFYAIAVLLLLSCGEDPQSITVNVHTENEYYKSRISIEGISGGLVQFNVIIEGSNGNAITGAKVIASDFMNRTKILYFNSNTYSYTGTMQDIREVNIYTIYIESALLNDRMVVNVPYLQFQNKPAITVLRDESGSSALSGVSVNGRQNIQVAWSTSGINTVYQVSIRTSLQILYTVVTEDMTVTIPENTLEPGSYLVSIRAQKICGDPLFNGFNYYSVSAENSMDVAFNVY